MALDVVLHGFGRPVLDDARQMHRRSLNAANTKERPNRVAPTPLKDIELGADRVQASLAPASWNVIRPATASTSMKPTRALMRHEVLDQTRIDAGRAAGDEHGAIDQAGVAGAIDHGRGVRGA